MIHIPIFPSSVLEWFFSLLQGIALVSIVAVFYLTFQILFPNVVPYPWPKGERSAKTVLIAGSFNPPHLGHLQMIQYLSSKYKHVFVVIGCNPNKSYSVSPQTRAEMLREMLSTNNNNNNVSVEIVSGYIWKFAITKNVQLFIRGIRTWDQDGEEERFLHILNSFGPLIVGPLVWPIPTIFLEGDPKYNHISSTLIRSVILQQQQEGSGTQTTTLHDIISQLVPATISSQVIQEYSK